MYKPDSPFTTFCNNKIAAWFTRLVMLLDEAKDVPKLLLNYEDLKDKHKLEDNLKKLAKFLRFVLFSKL